MDWRIKAGIQFVVARLPGGMQLNRALQDLRNGNPVPELRIRLLALAQELAWAERAGLRLQGARVLELGTGRTPVATVLMALMGSLVYAYDRSMLLSEKDTWLVCDQIVELGGELASILGRPRSQLLADAKRWLAKGTLEHLLEEARIAYRAPADATASGLPPKSIDAVVSFDVVEHLSRPTLRLLNLEARRVLISGGFQFHVIGLGDHYASLDRNITSAHFLKYSETAWHLLTGNSLSYHNRIRLPEFLHLFKEDSFEAVAVDREVDPKALQALKIQRVAREFREYSADELAVHRAKVLLKQVPAQREGAATIY
jgi:hypothetical protein